MDSLPSRAITFLSDENVDSRERKVFREFIQSHSRLIRTIADELQNLDGSNHFSESIHNTNAQVTSKYNAIMYKYGLVLDRYFEELTNHFQNRHNSLASELITKTFYFYMTGLISQGAAVVALLMRFVDPNATKDTTALFRAHQMMWLHYLKNIRIHTRLIQTYFGKSITSNQILSDWADLFFLSAFLAADIVAVAPVASMDVFGFDKIDKRYRYARDVFDKTGIMDLVVYNQAEIGIPLTADLWLEIMHSVTNVGLIMRVRRPQKLIAKPIRNRAALRKFYDRFVDQLMRDAVINETISDEQRFARLSTLYMINTFLGKFDNVINAKVFGEKLKTYNFKNKIELFIPVLERYAKTLLNPILINNAIHVFLNTAYQYQHGDYIQYGRSSTRAIVYMYAYLERRIRYKYGAVTTHAKQTIATDLKDVIEICDTVIKRSKTDKKFIEYNLSLLMKLIELRYGVYPRDRFTRTQYDFLEILMEDNIKDAYTKHINTLKE